MLATKVTARWAHSALAADDPGYDWDQAYKKVRKNMLEAFAETYSYSLQQTLNQMAERVLDNCPKVNEVRLKPPQQAPLPRRPGALRPQERQPRSTRGGPHVRPDRGHRPP
ncbi:hypothetical protein [Streptomyces virginiae]|uniref:hypothetical protein n=1 Tax=Streptomyces virginiae TaxID=1961 RepID=UPI0027E4CB46|nr:hypothetical protein [Streptomyces virginiae]